MSTVILSTVLSTDSCALPTMSAVEFTARLRSAVNTAKKEYSSMAGALSRRSGIWISVIPNASCENDNYYPQLVQQASGLGSPVERMAQVPCIDQ